MYDTSQQPQSMRERYKLLPEEITELFEYDTVSLVIDKIIREFGLREEARPILQMEIEMVLYLLLPRSSLSLRLQESLEIEKLRAEEISHKLDNELFIILDDVLEFAESQFSEDNDTTVSPVIVAPASMPEETAPTSEPTSQLSEKPTSNVKPLRTFAEDVEVSRAHSYGAFKSTVESEDNDEAVHTSSQNDLLGGRK